jgi:hypothetical protein
LANLRPLWVHCCCLPQNVTKSLQPVGSRASDCSIWFAADLSLFHLVAAKVCNPWCIRARSADDWSTVLGFAKITDVWSPVV